jgi:hypothetical protein
VTPEIIFWSFGAPRPARRITIDASSTSAKPKGRAIANGTPLSNPIGADERANLGDGEWR